MRRLPLNLIYLKYFYDAVTHGSISASAKCNSISQSAISQAITKLEEGVGYKLIAHQPNRFKVTEEGAKLYEASKGIFEAIRSAEEFMGDASKGSIDFACTHSFALSLLTHHLKESKTRFPSLTINFRLGHTDSIKEWIKKGFIDFGIVLDNEDLSSFDCEEIYRGHYRLYVSRKCQNTDQLSFLVSEERVETNLLKNMFRKRYDKDLPILMEISSWEVIASLTAEGLGIGFFPDYVAQARKMHLKPYPHEFETIPYKVYAIFPKNIPKSPHAINFLKLLKSRHL